jgi:hypothetical protein
MKKYWKSILIFAVFGVIGFLIYRWWKSRQTSAAAAVPTNPTGSTAGVVTAAGTSASSVITALGNLFKTS